GRMQAVHFVQGGYYRKGFGKHGPHTNPYAFRYFDAMPLDGDKRRMVHQWLVYGGGALPGYEGHLIGANSLSNFVADLKATPVGSSFTTVEGPKLIATADKWFRPIHSTTGPDGAIYISDFYDGRITHLDPRDNWDRDRGRVYRLRSREHEFVRPFNLGAESSPRLVERLSHKNRWFRETARRLLADRMDQSVGPVLLANVRDEPGQLALESLWALHSLGLLTDDLAHEGFAHPNPLVRLWTARLLADRSVLLSEDVFGRLLTLARQDRNPEVISQLAASAQRLPAEQGLPLVHALTGREGFTSDPHIPLQLWWAWEAQFTRDREAVLAGLEESVWQRPLFQEAVIENLARRVTSESANKHLGYAARLLQLAPDAADRSRLIDGLEAGMQGQTLTGIPDEARLAFDRLWSTAGEKDFRLIRFAMRLANPEAIEAARSFVRNPEADREERGRLIDTLAELRDDESLEILLDLATAEGEDQALRLTALNALRRFSDPSIPERLLKSLPSLEGDLAYTAQAILSGRKDWAEQMLGAVADGAIRRESVRYENLLLILSLGEAELSATIERNWGTLRQPAEDKAVKMKAIRLSLAAGGGDEENGRVLFRKACAVCHRLHGEGKEIGPDLTGYERDNREFLITAIIDPNLAVREEYEMATITLRPEMPGGESTVLAGFVTSLTNASVTLRDLAGNDSVISRKDILSENRSAVSMMPEGLLDGMKEEEIRDLFAYLGRK
ncbi:MAG: c-type cytochrome, partial [Verrucomicrobiota bacterium]